MKTIFKTLSLCIFIVLLITACGKVDKGMPTNVTTEERTPAPEPALRFTFEEIAAVEPKHFVGGSRGFEIKSSQPNYYGEITIGKRSYIEGASNDLDGTYALFVTDATGGTTTIDITFASNGFSYKDQYLGTKNGDAVKYPFPADDVFNSLRDCYYNPSQHFLVNKLSYLYADWRRSKSIFPERTFSMLAVVISKDEAIRYAQDGTLPNFLKGLTVEGLDKIFVNPENRP